MRGAKATPLMLFYGVFALTGAVVPWYFNIRYMQETGELLTPQALFVGGFINTITSSIMSDFLIGTTPILVWMVVEGRRLGMRYLWFYVLTTFLVAFAFSCPLFMLLREARLQTIHATHGDKLFANPSTDVGRERSR